MCDPSLLLSSQFLCKEVNPFSVFTFCPTTTNFWRWSKVLLSLFSSCFTHIKDLVCVWNFTKSLKKYLTIFGCPKFHITCEVIFGKRRGTDEQIWNLPPLFRTNKKRRGYGLSSLEVCLTESKWKEGIAKCFSLPSSPLTSLSLFHAFSLWALNVLFVFSFFLWTAARSVLSSSLSLSIPFSCRLLRVETYKAFTLL